MERETTDAIDALVDDPRFNDDTKARISGDNEAEVMLYNGHEDEQRKIITDEFGLEIANESYGRMSGDTVATVVDPSGDEPEKVETSESAEELISGW